MTAPQDTMQNRFILSSDWHLDDDPRHEYRWGIFQTMARWLRNPEVMGIANLGDLVHKKDRHRGTLVNRITEEFTKLRDIAQSYDPPKCIHILKGNHDYIDPSHAFFKFLGEIDGIEYHAELTDVVLPSDGGDRRFLFAPHGVDWGASSPLRRGQTLLDYDIAFAHQTFKGAISSSGITMGGDSLDQEVEHGKVCPPIIAGDIHVPQTMGGLTYVGSPHPVAFGDHFPPRLLSLDLATMELTSIPLAGIQRLSLEFEPTEDGAMRQVTIGVTVEAGDHVKVRYNAPRSELGRWSEVQGDLRDLLEKQLGATVFDIQFVCTDDGSVMTATGPAPENEKSVGDIFEAFVSEFGTPHEYAVPGRELIR